MANISVKRVESVRFVERKEVHSYEELGLVKGLQGIPTEFLLLPEWPVKFAPGLEGETFLRDARPVVVHKPRVGVGDSLVPQASVGQVRVPQIIEGLSLPSPPDIVKIITNIIIGV